MKRIISCSLMQNVLGALFDKKEYYISLHMPFHHLSFQLAAESEPHLTALLTVH